MLVQQGEKAKVPIIMSMCKRGAMAEPWATPVAWAGKSTAGLETIQEFHISSTNAQDSISTLTCKQQKYTAHAEPTIIWVGKVWILLIVLFALDSIQVVEVHQSFIPFHPNWGTYFLSINPKPLMILGIT